MVQAKRINECLHAYGIHSTTLQPELVTPECESFPSLPLVYYVVLFSGCLGNTPMYGGLGCDVSVVEETLRCGELLCLVRI